MERLPGATTRRRVAPGLPKPGRTERILACPRRHSNDPLSVVSIGEGVCSAHSLGDADALEDQVRCSTALVEHA